LSVDSTVNPLCTKQQFSGRRHKNSCHPSAELHKAHSLLTRIHERHFDMRTDLTKRTFPKEGRHLL